MDVMLPLSVSQPMLLLHLQWRNHVSGE